jgi:hypothetical protein
VVLVDTGKQAQIRDLLIGVTERNRTSPRRDLDEAPHYNEFHPVACVDQLPHQGSRQRPPFRAR